MYDEVILANTGDSKERYVTVVDSHSESVTCFQETGFSFVFF